MKNEKSPVNEVTRLFLRVAMFARMRHRVILAFFFFSSRDEPREMRDRRRVGVAIFPVGPGTRLYGGGGRC